MSTSKPEIVFIHGAWSPPSSYARFTDLLESRGFTVHIPELSSLNGSRPPTSNLATDTAQIREFVTDLVDEGRSIIVLMHSYGGHVGTNALTGLGIEARRQNNLPGGIERLVYICAAAYNVGESMLTIVEKHGQMDLMSAVFPSEEDGTCVCSDPRTILLGPGLSDEEFESWVSQLRPWNGISLGMNLEHCAWLEIPVSYVMATADMTMPWAYQKEMIANMEAHGRKVQTFQLETGHCPPVTTPEDMVKIVEEIVRDLSA